MQLRTFIALACGSVVFIAPPTFAGDVDRAVSRHVLLISIDGMHAVDLHNCSVTHTCPNLLSLKENGVNYSRTATAKPSDSYPGLMAIVTGGTPKLVGAYYDVAYDRVLAPPAVDTGNGVLHGLCVVGRPNGTRTEYEEGVDLDQTKLNGGGPYGAFDGGYLSIDSKKLPRDPYRGCGPVYPWNFIRANTVFGVIHDSGRYTAWSDKHAVYAAVSGPTGTSQPSNLDDFYAPEVNSTVVALPGVKTATGLDCSIAPQGSGADWTGDFDTIKCNDQLRVNAVLNWIRGKDHLGTADTAVPALFGMNFQSVSVGQKLIEQGVKGGYTDALGSPTPEMLREIEYVDAAIGQMVAELEHQNLLQSTTIIVTAKHGQSPIDPNRFLAIPGHTGANGEPPSVILGSTYLPDSELNQIGATEDDISLLWLKPGASTVDAIALLESKAKSAGIAKIYAFRSIQPLYGIPGLPSEGGDPRTPDIIVEPNPGVVYTGSLKKQSEHGGFSADDTNVMLLVSNPALRPRTVAAFVETAQIAPTILQVLGLDPNKLQAVQKEATPALPGLHFISD